ncbi:MAG: hypothetical protein IKM66_04285 [Clostridia bacterium]|nr:hypothetical protein [Clostridia bacterium]
MDDKTIFRLNDDISFRKCSLFDGDELTFGNCTNFSTAERNWRTYYSCNQDGIHFHCTTHPEIELEVEDESYGNVTYRCPKCRKSIEVENRRELKNSCLRMLNIPEFKDAKLIRLDDWYVHEIKEKVKEESGYWLTTNVKTDKDGDTIIVVYVGHKDSNEKVQFFIKPEKGQLTSDHKDMDPAKILSKIEVHFKGRKLTQDFDND